MIGVIDRHVNPSMSQLSAFLFTCLSDNRLSMGRRVLVPHATSTTRDSSSLQILVFLVVLVTCHVSSRDVRKLERLRLHGLLLITI